MILCFSAILVIETNNYTTEIRKGHNMNELWRKVVNEDYAMGTLI